MGLKITVELIASANIYSRKHHGRTTIEKIKNLSLSSANTCLLVCPAFTLLAFSHVRNLMIPIGSCVPNEIRGR